MPQTIRSKPATAASPAVDSDHLVSCLRRYDRGFRTRWLLMFFLGMVAVWIGPFLAATIFWMLQFQVGGIPDTWTYVFMWSLWVIPLLFILEWATRGIFLDDAVDGMGGAGNMSASFGHRQWAVLALLTEISLWGPRIIFTSINRLSRAAKLGVNPHPGGAAVLVVLLRREDGTPTSTVLTACGLSAEAFGDALAYLMYHEWIDLSKDGLYLWILSDAKRRLK
jgi:hypothetical protein